MRTTGLSVLLLVTACGLGSCRSETVSRPVAVIFDTDMATDCDDAGALAMLHALERRGEARILATMVNNKGMHSAGATAAINAFYGRPDVPVGAYQGDAVGLDAAAFYREIALDTAAYGHTATSRDELPAAVTVYRQVLGRAGPREVVVISVGHLNNLYELLASGPDDHSPLNGVDLVSEKVDHLVVMGGHFLPDVRERYPHGREHNFFARGSAQFTGAAIERWPTRILFSGYEIGERILTGQRLANLDDGHPVRRAYAAHPSQPLVNGRMSWDQTAVLAAIRDPGLYWDLSPPGRATVDAEGRNSWTAVADGVHRYLVERAQPAPSELATIIEDLMVHVP
jgi:hypothetical protein